MVFFLIIDLQKIQEALDRQRKNVRKGGAKIPQLKTPRTFDGTLRNYQKVGAAWIQDLQRERCSGILADDMGLGKSIQSIHAICNTIRRQNDAKVLVICKKSLQQNWSDEFDKFTNLSHEPDDWTGKIQLVEFLDHSKIGKNIRHKIENGKWNVAVITEHILDKFHSVCVLKTKIQTFVGQTNGVKFPNTKFVNGLVI